MCTELEKSFILPLGPRSPEQNKREDPPKKTRQKQEAKPKGFRTRAVVLPRSSTRLSHHSLYSLLSIRVQCRYSKATTRFHFYCCVYDVFDCFALGRRRLAAGVAKRMSPLVSPPFDAVNARRHRPPRCFRRFGGSKGEGRVVTHAPQRHTQHSHPSMPANNYTQLYTTVCSPQSTPPFSLSPLSLNVKTCVC